MKSKENDMLDVYQYVTDLMIDALEKNIIPWQKPWSGDEYESPYNFSTGNPYKGINIILLRLCSRAKLYNRNVWIGYKQAAKLGGNVKKGEKATKVVKWNVLYEDKSKTVISGMYPILLSVFNIAQVDGLDLPEIKRIKFNTIEKAVSIWDGMPNKPQLVHETQQGFYSPSKDLVNLPEADTFLTPEGYYATLFHEIVHSTHHKTRLGERNIGRAAEELVAEIGCAFLCADAGIIDKTIENSISYCQGWAREFKEKPRMILKTAGMAEKARAYILDIKLPMEATA